MKKIILVLLLALTFFLPQNVYATDYEIDEPCAIVCEEELEVEESFVSEKDENIYNAPIIGEFDARDVSILFLAMVIGAVDGFNPCALWILVFLITMLFNVEDPKKRWTLGLAFIITSGVVYFFLMTAWLNLAMFLTQIRLIRLLISIFAITFGMFSLYKYLQARNQEVGCDVTTSKQKTKIANKLRNIINQKRFVLALLGIILLSASINILEAVCSLGLPVMFTQVLVINELSQPMYLFYIGIYVLFFVLNELVIFIIAMKTMKVKGISNKYTKYANLIGGIIMLLLGLLMALKPEWLMFNF